MPYPCHCQLRECRILWSIAIQVFAKGAWQGLHVASNSSWFFIHENFLHLWLNGSHTHPTCIYTPRRYDLLSPMLSDWWSFAWPWLLCSLPLWLTYSPSCLDEQECTHDNTGCYQSWRPLLSLTIHWDLWFGSVVEWFKIKQSPTSCYQISRLSILSSDRYVWCLKMKHPSGEKYFIPLSGEVWSRDCVSLTDKTKIQRGVSNRTGLCK